MTHMYTLRQPMEQLRLYRKSVIEIIFTLYLFKTVLERQTAVLPYEN